MKDIVPKRINYIPDVMSEFDCHVLNMMKWKRNLKAFQMISENLKDIEHAERFVFHRFYH